MIRSALAGLVAAAAYLALLTLTDDVVTVVATTLLLLGLGLGGWLALMAAATPADTEPDPRETAAGRTGRPERLARLEGLLAEAADRASAEHQRLRPVLREIADAYEVDDPLLGEPAPDDRRASGRGLDGLNEIVTALDRATRR